MIAYSPIVAIRYFLAHLRCASCQQTFTASLPDEASANKYQPSANAAAVLMNCALGVPAKLGYLIRGYKKKAEKKCSFLIGKKVTPHTFRHTTALHLLQAGNHLSVVKDWLGHADINTTHQYLDIDMEMKRKALEAAEPLTIPRSEPLWRKPDVLKFLEQLEKSNA